MDESQKRDKPGPKPNNNMITEAWHEDYINLLADPQDKTNNVTFYKSVPIDERTFYRWLKRFRIDVYDEANRRLKARRGELRIKGWKRLEDMMDDKSGGNVLKALELFFKLNGDLVERVEQRTELLTPEQKKVRLAAFLSEISAKKGNSNEQEVSESKGDVGSSGSDDSEASGDGIEPRNNTTSGGS